MNLRLTWVQPEDLVGHELRQAAEDGRDARALAARWYEAGGPPAPETAGASELPRPDLRPLAEELLGSLANLPTPVPDDEPTSLPEIRSLAAPQALPPPDSEAAGGDALRDRLHAAWLGRAAGCLLGKPVEKLPLAAIRSLARATGNWPLSTWFTARGVPPELLAAHPWNRRSAATSLAENIDGMPEDDDLNYPLLNLLLLQRYGRDFATADVARLWLDELPAGRTFTAERVAYRNLLDGVEPPLTAVHRNPFREWIGAQIRRTSTAGPTPATRRPPPRRPTGTLAHPLRERRLRRHVRAAPPRAPPRPAPPTCHRSSPPGPRWSRRAPASPAPSAWAVGVRPRGASHLRRRR
ncbi:hypothetical protein SNARM312S_08273 [Streptomyces narbonensis]